MVMVMVMSNYDDDDDNGDEDNGDYHRRWFQSIWPNESDQVML